MKFELLYKAKVLLVIFLFVGAVFISNVGAVSNTYTKSQIQDKSTENFGDGVTEYWALLVAVGVYADNPEQNRPLMLEEVDDLYDVLIDSPWWSEDHIKVIKAEDATVLNIVRGLRWLDRMEDSDDFSLVFLTTHGSPIAFDIPPFDEEDGMDEILVSYWGFAYPGLYIWDDQLNVLLNRLESQGVCLIVDSCYAGGFNDPPNWNITNRNILPFQGPKSTMSSRDWMEGFAEDVRGQGRVVLMASREDEVSFSGGFAPYLIDGLRGFADSNMDNVISAEEAFFYTEPRASRQHPTIYDGYEGELLLIDLTGKNTNTAEKGKIIGKESNISEIYNVNLPENSVVYGYIKDEKDNPIEDASIELSGRDNEWDFYQNNTNSDSFGFYSMNIPAGRYRITVYADGYCGDESGPYEVDENEILWVNFTLYPHPLENSVVCGYITDSSTNDPIEGVNISLFWQGEQFQFYRNDTVSEQNGFYTMKVAAGDIFIDADKDGYFHKYLDNIAVEDFEIRWVNFSMYPRPLENSVVCGYISDEKTGSPINDARITFEWFDATTGDNYDKDTRSDSSGFYSINIAPGELYIDIREQGYEFYDPYRHDSVENSVVWLNFSLETETIEVNIAKPLRALYLNNNRVIPFIRTRIIGPIDIEAYVYESWHGPGNVEKIEIYIDDNLKANLTSWPYIWTWEKKTFGKHTIKVIAYDSEGEISNKEIEVFKFL